MEIGSGCSSSITSPMTSFFSNWPRGARANSRAQRHRRDRQGEDDDLAPGGLAADRGGQPADEQRAERSGETRPAMLMAADTRPRAPIWVLVGHDELDGGLVRASDCRPQGASTSMNASTAKPDTTTIVAKTTSATAIVWLLLAAGKPADRQCPDDEAAAGGRTDEHDRSVADEEFYHGSAGASVPSTADSRGSTIAERLASVLRVEDGATHAQGASQRPTPRR